LNSTTRRPNFDQKRYLKESVDRQKLSDAVEAFKRTTPLEVPLVVGGKQVTGRSWDFLKIQAKNGTPQIRGTSTQTQHNPASHADVVAKYSVAGEEEVAAAIESALEAKEAWETLPFADRAAVFLKAADLISGKYRYDIMAATMVGQGKNAWQAEIDAAAELADFLRFNVKYAEEIYSSQPPHNSPGVWK
jgi:1-pyrroline-5-carboxylate dehydrogenase